MTSAANNPGSSVSVTTSSTAVVAGMNDRRYLLIQNLGPSRVSLSLGGTAENDKGIILEPDGGWEMSNNEYTGPITGISAAGTSTVAVTEY